jgi:hypothetical protein
VFLANLAADHAAKMHRRRLARLVKQLLRRPCVAGHDVHVLRVDGEDAASRRGEGHGLFAEDGPATVVRCRVREGEHVVGSRVLRERVHEGAARMHGAWAIALLCLLASRGHCDCKGCVGRRGARGSGDAKDAVSYEAAPGQIQIHARAESFDRAVWWCDGCAARDFEDV